MSTETGRLAEAAAATFLQHEGYTVLGQNWRTRWCEIDIIATRERGIYFVEVKYRSHLALGSGFDYITPKKLQQMHFAAEFWLSRHGNQATDYYLAAVELTGSPPRVSNWLPDVN